MRAVLLCTIFPLWTACIPPATTTVGGNDSLQRKIAQIGEDLRALRQETQAVADGLQLIAGTTNSEEEMGTSETFEWRVGLEALRAEMQILSDKLDATNFQMNALAQELNDLQERDAGSAADEQGPLASAERLYHAAFSDYLRARYQAAVIAFQSYLERYPATELADNALFWLSECYLAQESPDLALTTLSRLIEEYPDGDKIPAGLLRRGLIFLEQDKLAQGVMQLQHLIEEHPLSEESRQAKQQLEEMGLRGR